MAEINVHPITKTEHRKSLKVTKDFDPLMLRIHLQILDYKIYIRLFSSAKMKIRDVCLEIKAEAFPSNTKKRKIDDLWWKQQAHSTNNWGAFNMMKDDIY